MGGGGKGGSQSQETKIPEWVRPYAEENLRLGQAVQRLGYMPYYGPDVAGFNEWDVAAAQAAREGAEAFGYAAPSEQAVTEMYPLGPQSSGELYDQAMAELRARRPSQMAYYDQFFVNPTESAQLVAPYSLTMGQSNDPLWEQMLADADAAHRAQFGIGWDTERTSGAERQGLLQNLQAQYKAAKKQQMGVDPYSAQAANQAPAATGMSQDDFAKMYAQQKAMEGWNPVQRMIYQSTGSFDAANNMMGGFHS